jgi:hypothetical protein
LSRRQGDQIGRIVACWEILFFGQLFCKWQMQHKSLGYFFHGEVNVLFFTKMGWAIFWAICSQAHVVTLLEGKGEPNLIKY